MSKNVMIPDCTRPFFEVEINRKKYKYRSGTKQEVQDDVAAVIEQHTEAHEKKPVFNGGSQPDWNQNDPTKPDYVKNRTHWTDDPVETVILEETTAEFTDSGMGVGLCESIALSVEEDAEYLITFDGVDYNLSPVSFNNILCVGNLGLLTGTGDTGEPFLICPPYDDNAYTIVTQTTGEHTVKVVVKVKKIHKIDPKYMPDGVANPVVIELNDDLTFSRNGTPIETAEVCRLWDSGVNIRFVCAGVFGATVKACAYSGEEMYMLSLEMFGRMSGGLGRLHEWMFGPNTAEYMAYDFTITKADV